MEHVDVLIVGAGLSGIGAACHLRRNHPERSFVILEARSRIGGTWDLFRYPGIRSDSDMFTFGYVFKPWVEDRDIATAESIRNYLHETVDEYQLEPQIQREHRVETFSWSSSSKRWVIRGLMGAPDNGERQPFEISCNVLITCTGYYNYERGYQPEFEGLQDFEGATIHPQHWPEDLDYSGKKIVVVGSGATAVTLVPALTDKAEHVVMLQRSPTYIFSRPARDAIAQALRRFLPERVAYPLARLKNIVMQRYLYTVSKKFPERVRAYLREMAKTEAGPDVDVDVHFNPDYDPWDQRLCLIPDGDFYNVLKQGSASVLTDTIDHFDTNGMVLESGQRLEADIVVFATGLELQFLGGAQMDIDGEPVRSQNLICYKGMMFSGVPNWVAMFGYTSASWTLKTDLSADFICRLLSYMDANNYSTFVPQLDQPKMPTESVLSNLGSAGYVKRSAHLLPRQGLQRPWRNKDSYFGDYVDIKFGKVDDGILQFDR